MQKKTLLNVFLSIGLQFSTIISGLIVPRLILSYFGSDVNGLISSLNQFLNYISLLEGGVSGVVMASLYKPLAQNDSQKLSGIFNAVRKFFFSIGKIYVVYLLCVAIFYPLIIDTKFKFSYIFSLTLILGVNLFVQYFFSLSYKILLNADRQIYFTATVQIIAVWLNLFLVLILISIYPDVHLIKLGSAVVYLLQPLCYHLFAKKHYHINWSIPADDEALKQRWDGFGQNLAYYIHTNTDVIILTAFSSLSDVSVYGVYFMVANSLKGLINSVAAALNPSLGNLLVSKDEKSINRFFDRYEFLIGVITSFMFSNAIILIVPFVQLYTKGVTDANYFQPEFGILLLMAESVYCFREPYVGAAYSSGHFKETAKYAYIEAGMNLLISLILVRPLGLVGIAIGTLVSMLYRMVAHILYLRKNILMRKVRKCIQTYAKVIIGSIIGIISFHMMFDSTVGDWIGWILLALKSCAYLGTIYFIIIFFGFRKYISEFSRFFSKH